MPFLFINCLLEPLVPEMHLFVKTFCDRVRLAGADRDDMVFLRDDHSLGTSSLCGINDASLFSLAWDTRRLTGAASGLMTATTLAVLTALPNPILINPDNRIPLFYILDLLSLLFQSLFSD